MRLVDGSVTLVIAGAWNEAILTPAWVAKYALGMDGEISVTMTTPFANAFGQAAVATSYELPGLKYAVHPASLVLSPVGKSLEGLDKVQAAARAILGVLTHTPVVAVGLNAGFEASAPGAGLLDAFRDAQIDVIDAAPDGWAAERNRIHTSLSKEGNKLNVDKSYDGHVVRAQFNFHNPVTTAQGAIDVLDRLSLRMAFEQARDMARVVFAEELQDDPDNAD